LRGARLTRSNLEGTNFSGADLNMTTFGMDEKLLNASWGIIIFSITANNLLFKHIIFGPLKKRFILIDQECESDEEKLTKFLIEFVKLIQTSRLTRSLLKLIRSIFSITCPKASRLNVTYDEIALNSLLNAKNLDKAEFYGPIKKDLIEKSRDTVNDPDIDLELKESLKKFLDTTKVDENHI